MSNKGTILLLLQDKLDWAKIVGVSTSILAASIGGGYVVYSAIQKVRKAKSVEQKNIQKQIDDAIAVVKLEYQHQLDMANKTTEHWQSMAVVFEKERNHEREVSEHDKQRFESDTTRLRSEKELLAKQLAGAKLKVEEVIDLNLGLQGQITENKNNLKTASEATASLQLLVTELQEKVTKIDGVSS